MEKMLYNTVVLLTIVPTQLVPIIGFYKYMASLKLLNSYIPLIVPAIASPPMVFLHYNIWNLR